ncbi:MAG: hypothetical protein J5674_05590, partial [Candidatus Methanomethylophilaceae archaeon]|nr:hypothetical protein [Candidatus Methanomethylophilaceae archaeon]
NRLRTVRPCFDDFQMPLSLAELHLGDPEGATCDAMRMLDTLFRKGEDPRRSLERVATEFNIQWTDEMRSGYAMDMMEAIVAEYRRGLIESGREEGREEAMSEMRAVMVSNYARTVSKAVSEGMDEGKAMALVPDDIVDEVRKALEERQSRPANGPGLPGSVFGMRVGAFFSFFVKSRMSWSRIRGPASFRYSGLKEPCVNPSGQSIRTSVP